MRSRRQWVLWRYEHRDGKPTKVPYQVNGSRASSVDPTNWADFDTAAAAHATQPEAYDGVGFVFSGEAGDWVGVDLDGCLDGDELKPWAKDILDRMPGYAEISPSGKGIKIFCRGEFPADRGRKVRFSESTGIEMYGRGRYFTVTGRAVGTPAAGDASEGLQWLATTHFGGPAPHRPTKAHEGARGPMKAQDRTALPYAPGQYSEVRAIERAEAYAAAYPPAVSGQDGHGVTFRLACVLVNGFALDANTALGILHRWNAGCNPPWSSKELDHKVASAVEVGDRDGDRGYMLVDRQWGIEPASPEEFEAYTGDLLASYQAALNTDFPPDLLNVPGFVSDVARHVTTQNPRPNVILSLIAGLTLQSVLVARKVKDKTGLRTNLYIVALAPSSGGKQAPQAVIQEILGLTGQSFLYGGKVASDSAIAQDLTTSPAKLYIFDEFGRFLQKTRENTGGAHLHAVQEALLELWGSTRNPLWKHKSMAESKFNREVPFPCVSFIGWSVPENFWDGLEESHLHDGFAARLLVIDSGPRPASRTPIEMSPPAHVLERAAYWRDFAPGGNLAQAGRFDPIIIPTTDEAEGLFQKLVELQESKEGVAAEAIWSRAIEKARRLAMVYACSRDHVSPVVDGEAARWAIKFVRWATETFMEKAFDEVTGGEAFQIKVKKALKIIKDKSKRRNICTRSILLKATKWRARELDDVLDTLLESEQITSVLVGEGKGARTSYRAKK
jgi:hypothetical protein